MKRLFINVDEKINEEIEKISSNKSEFIRKAIIEKLEKSDQQLLKINDKILKKIEELFNKNIDIENKLFLLNSKIETQAKLNFKIFEELYKINILITELHTDEKLALLKNSAYKKVQEKLNILQQQFEI